MSDDKKKIAMVFATYTLADPTTRNTISSISNLFKTIIVFQQNSRVKYAPLESKNVKIITISTLEQIPSLFGLRNLLKWIFYIVSVQWTIKRYKPQLLITFMLRPLAAIKLKPYQTLISCIYDIPDPLNTGKIDSIINKKGFQKLKQAKIVWASDVYKAEYTKQFASLEDMPLVCYNCPSLETIDSNKEAEKVWLRNMLRKSGAVIGGDTGTVLIRAGAIGPYGGIEETLAAMKELPENNLFLMMGRPDVVYRNKIIDLIQKENLSHRAFLWDKPDDNIWRKAILGADIGHLIHLPPPEDSSLAGSYKYNTSLSNYRLFTYMASGIPILSYNEPRLDDFHTEVNCFYVIDMKHPIEDIRRGWKKLSEDSLLREKMGIVANGSFQFKYNWEFQFENIKKIITNII